MLGEREEPGFRYPTRAQRRLRRERNRALQEDETTAKQLYPGDAEQQSRYLEAAWNGAKDRAERIIAAWVPVMGTLEKSWWQADHDKPVHRGGGECGLENMKTRCTRCHKAKSAREAAERARDRRREKELRPGQEQPTLLHGF